MLVQLGKMVREYGKHFLISLMILRTIYSEHRSDFLTSSETKENHTGKGRQGS